MRTPVEISREAGDLPHARGWVLTEHAGAERHEGPTEELITMGARAWLRTGLIILALYHFILGVWTQFLPRSFYDSFPTPGHAWVALHAALKTEEVEGSVARRLIRGFLLAKRI